MKKKVVVANDEEDILRLISDRLIFYGFEVYPAPDGTACIQRIAAESPDLVILDVWMPDVNGLEVLRRIRSTQPTLPVLMISASVERELVQECLEIGAIDFLKKPFEPRELKEKVLAILGEEMA